jgi:hypothetical protein
MREADIGGFKPAAEFKAFIIPYIRATWKDDWIVSYDTEEYDPSHSWLTKMMNFFVPGISTVADKQNKVRF